MSHLSHAERRRLFDEMVTAFGRRDFDRFETYLTPDAVFERERSHRTARARGYASPCQARRMLAHAARLQTQVPGAVLVGGTAAALHARHRFSVDHDHVVQNLAKNCDEALRALESIVGWHHPALERLGCCG